MPTTVEVLEFAARHRIGFGAALALLVARSESAARLPTFTPADGPWTRS
jgi:hypothetical protein